MMVKINNQAGILVDISRNGFKLSTTSIPCNRHVDITLQTDDQIFYLKGYTCWVSRKLAAQKLYDIGISIREASEEYYDFLDRLFSVKTASPEC